MKTLAGSIDKQLMLDEGLASVSNPTTFSVKKTQKQVYWSGDAACNTTMEL